MGKVQLDTTNRFLQWSQLSTNKQVKALVTSIEEMGNPFLDESAYLRALYPEEILEDTVVRTIRNIETIGEKLHSEYVEQRQVKSTTAISHPLSKQHIPLFSKRGTKVRSRSQLEVAPLKVNRNLMSRVYTGVYPANRGRYIWMISSCMKIVHIVRVCLTMGIYVQTLNLI